MKMNNPENEHISLERIIPDELRTGESTGAETLKLHLERYRFAGRNITPGIVGDFACGSGYGSHLLATEFGDKIEQLIAADIDPEAIEYATKRYAHPKICYMSADFMSFIPNQNLSTIISLETIEHLADPSGFVGKMAALLPTGGRLIASAPVTPSMDANPHHLHDFTPRSFRKLFKNTSLREIDSLLQVQYFNPLRLAGKKEKRSYGLRRNMAAFYLKHPMKLLLRLHAILTKGFSNHYLVLVFEKTSNDDTSFNS